MSFEKFYQLRYGSLDLKGLSLSARCVSEERGMESIHATSRVNGLGVSIPEYRKECIEGLIKKVLAMMKRLSV